jgi:hypothetical protein
MVRDHMGHPVAAMVDQVAVTVGQVVATVGLVLATVVLQVLRNRGLATALINRGLVMQHRRRVMVIPKGRQVVMARLRNPSRSMTSHATAMASSINRSPVMADIHKDRHPVTPVVPATVTRRPVIRGIMIGTEVTGAPEVSIQ